MQKDPEQKMYDACYALLKACYPGITGYNESITNEKIKAPSTYIIKRVKRTLDKRDADLIVAALKARPGNFKAKY